MIDAKEAHIWWHHESGDIFVEKFLSPADRRVDDRLGWQDCGASFTRWRNEMSDADRILEMQELSIDLMVSGDFDPVSVIREFSRVGQFRALSLASHYMCSAITKSVTGVAYDCSFSAEDALDKAERKRLSRNK